MCNFFQESESSKYRNIEKSVWDILIRIRFPFETLFGYPYPVANSLSCRISNWQTGYLSSLLKIRDDRIVDFYYPILSCFFKMISVPDSNPVLVETMLSVSENYPKVYCDAQHTFLCCVYFAS